MNLNMLGTLKRKVMEWDAGTVGSGTIDKRVVESLLGLYVAQTFPTTKMLLEKVDAHFEHRATADEVRAGIAALINKDNRRLSNNYFNNDTIGISKQFRDSGLRIIEEAENERK